MYVGSTVHVANYVYYDLTCSNWTFSLIRTDKLNTSKYTLEGERFRRSEFLVTPTMTTPTVQRRRTLQVKIHLLYYKNNVLSV